MVESDVGLSDGQLEALIFDVFGNRAGLARNYYSLLSTLGIEWGLIGPREVDRLWVRHILPSGAIARLLSAEQVAGDGSSTELAESFPQQSTKLLRIVDVGSGAGLPGIPLALANPNFEVTLLEPMLRRVNFLSLVVDKLGLTDQVSVVRGRAEEHNERYDIVCSRAVAALPKLLAWCWPLVAAEGRVVAVKGAAAGEEIVKAAKQLKGKSAEIVSVVVRSDKGLFPDISTTTVVIEAIKQ